MGDDEEWTVYWTDTSVLLERVMDMKRYQVCKKTKLLNKLICKFFSHRKSTTFLV